MEPQPPISSEEIRGTLFTIADISVNVQAIRELLEGDDGEEEDEEVDS